MSKLDIGVGSEFPLDEGQDESRFGDDPRAFKEEYRARRRAWRHHRHGHHHHHGHHFHPRRHGVLHLPLILGVAVIAAMIGAGKIPPLASHVILALAAVLVVLALGAHLWLHRRWHQEVR